MKKIGTLEENYIVYWKSKGKFRIEFQYDGHTISLADFESYPRLSEETLAFSANLIVDGVMVGDCSNEGRGGCANWHTYTNRELVWELANKVKEVEMYCFPSLKESFADIIDVLASYYDVFQRERSAKSAKEAVDELQKHADELRLKYSR